MPETHLKLHALTGKRRVLIVDDELINREMLGIVLEDDYELLFAETGEEALAQVRDHCDFISLILLDLNLPDMHGLDIIRRLKAKPQTGRIPIIVLTSEKDAEVDSLNLGASDFIPKPYPQPNVVQARVLRTIELAEDRDIIRWTERDQLTELYNKEYFYRYVEQFDIHNKDLPTDAAVVDISHFRMMNERYGRPYGDEVLRRVARRLRALMQELGGMVCRRESDTFLTYCPHREDWPALLERVMGELAAEDPGENRIRLRMGLYANVDKSLEVEHRFDRAKLAADKVRGSYAKAFAVYDEAMHEAELFAEQLLEGFDRAISERQFRVYYQPKFDIRPATPLLNSAEALIRWKHPKLGMISPGTFVPLFEANGLIPRLDGYVWREAARQMREWKDRLGFTVPVSVNVSRVDMFDPGLVEHMKALVEEFGLERRELLLEITESAYTEDSAQIIDTVKRFRDEGFIIEMDDFGAGYSSLNMISTLPIDALKLDMQFIRNAFSERRNTRMLEIVLDIAESLSAPTIAEGVETAEQLLALKSMGCDIAQGYYFSRPVPPEEFEPFLLKRREAEAALAAPAGRAPGESTAENDYIYDAMHDPLTGLYNASAFDMLLKDADQGHIALIIADIKGLRTVAEEHGRAVRDRVICAVAELLHGSFRSVDHVCRIRKDEFAVIMTRVDSSKRGLVFEKIAQINEKLRRLGETLPPVTLSVGVAFSDRENPQGDIVHDADAALYRLRGADGSGCAIF